MTKDMLPEFILPSKQLSTAMMTRKVYTISIVIH